MMVGRTILCEELCTVERAVNNCEIDFRATDGLHLTTMQVY